MSEDWIRIQRKAFTRWCNTHLLDRNLVIEVIEKDLSDGVILHALMEILSGKQLPKVVKNPKSNFQKIQNLNHSLQMMTKQEQIKLVNIGAEDIMNENVKLILGLIWMLILKYQISKAEYEDDPNSGPRKALLDWCNRVLNPQGVYVMDFTSSWQDGAAFCGLVNAIEPGTIDLSKLDRDNERADNMNKAFTNGEEKFGIAQLLDAEDVLNHPDELSVMTYVSLYRAYLSQTTPDASKCYAEGPGLTEGVTRQKAPFTVFTFNDEGEAITRGGARVNVTVVGPDGKETKGIVKDKLDGTYDCHYEVRNPGQYTLNILVAGHPIKDSPFHPEIKTSGPSALNTYVTGEGIEKVVAGVPTEFTIHTQDESGSPLTEGGFNFPSTFEDPSGVVEVSVEDNNDGTYKGTYTPKTAGNTTLIVLYRSEEDGDQHVKDSPFTVAVIPGPIDLNNIEVTGKGVEEVVAGQKGEVFIQAKDSCGNIVPLDPNQVSVSIQGPGEVTTENAGDDEGKVVSSYVPTVVGDYDVYVKVDDQNVREEPFKVRVISDNKSDPNNSVVEGIEDLIAGENQSPIVKLFDQFGNPVTESNDDVKIKVSGPADVDASVKNNGDGTFSGDYAPTKAGEYDVEVTVNGKKVKGTPVKIVVSPTDADAGHTVASGEGVKKAKVGKTAKFTVQLYDRYDNKIKTNPGVTITSSIVLIPKEPLAEGEEAPQPIEVAVEDKNDGSFSASYDVAISGKYTLSVLLDGQNIKDSEFSINVTPGKVHLPNTKVVISGGKAGESGGVIKLSDANNNPRHKGGQKVTATFKPKKLPDDPTGDNNDGTYNIVLPPNAKGDYSVEVECDGEKVPGGPFDISVEENDLDEEQKEQVSTAFPNSSEGLNELLKNAPASVRDQFFKDLANLQNGEPQPVEESQPEPEPVVEETQPEPEPVTEEAQPEPEPEPVVEETQPEPEPVTEEAQPEPEPEPVVEEAQPEPEPEPVTEEAQPEPEPEPVTEEAQPEPEPVTEEAQPEPEPEPVAEEAKTKKSKGEGEKPKKKKKKKSRK